MLTQLARNTAIDDAVADDSDMTTPEGSDIYARTTPPGRTVRTKSGRVVLVTKSMIASALA